MTTLKEEAAGDSLDRYEETVLCALLTQACIVTIFCKGVILMSTLLFS